MRKTALLLFILFMVGIMAGGCSHLNQISVHKKKNKQGPNQQAINKFTDGVILDMQGNYAGALLAYQEALLYDSTSAEINLAIARDYLVMGKEESGKKFLERTFKLDPDNIEALELMSKVLIRQNKLNEAEEYLEKIIFLDSTSVESLHNLALIYLQKRQTKKAVEMYNRILRVSESPDPELYLQLGDLYFELGQYEDAEEVFFEFNKIKPFNGHGYYGLGLVREALKDTAKAIANYKKALSLSPGLEQVSKRLGIIFLEQKRVNQGITFFKEQIHKDSSQIQNWFVLADIYRQNGDTLKSIDTYQSMKKIFPEDMQVRIELGRVYLDNNDNQAAFTEFSEIQEKDPENTSGWLWQGINLIQMDSLDAAVEDLQKALELSPDNPLGNYYLGVLYIQKDRPGESIPHLKKALMFNPDWIPALLSLANSYESIKQYSIADSLYQRILKIDPNNATVLNNYGYSLSIRGINLDKALSMAKRAVKMDPENGSFLDTIGWILYKKGNYQEALEYLQKAFLKREDSAEVADHLGDVYKRLGMEEKARMSWEKALELEPNNSTIKSKLNQIMD
ncbi:MAG: tetratricopeptide repeat protein [bacterium]